MALAAACVERAVYEGPGSFELITSSEIRNVRLGSSIEINVAALRGEGSDGPIALTAEALPRGFSVEPGAIAAGVDKGVITVRADAALAGTSYEVLIVGRGDGAVAEREVQLFVTGKRGTVDAYFPRIGERPQVDVPPPHALLPISPRGGLLLSADTGFYRYGANGLPDQAFGANGFAFIGRGPYGDGQFSMQLPQVVGELSNGLLIVAVGYADGDGHAHGILLYRIAVDGKLDHTYGRSGDAVSVAIPRPGFLPFSVKVLDDDELMLHVVNGEGATEMMSISSRGEVLGSSSELPAVGQLGAERREMVMQPDGKLVAAGPSQLVRFTTELAVDVSFGQGGALPTGTEAPFVAAFEGGYMVAGATAAGPAFWGFDAQWRALPGFEGGLVIPGMSGRAVSAHAVDGGFNIAIASDRAQVVRARRDGTLDPTFGKNGVLDLGPLPAENPLVPHFPTSHGRFYSVIVNGPLYQVTRYWGE